VTARRLGGAAGFHVRWSGTLLVHGEGEYAFHAGAPTPEGQPPDLEGAARSQWRMTLRRGQKTWVVFSHRWPGNPDHPRHAPRLRRGAYQIVVELIQPPPDFPADGQPHPQQTGFEVKYAGPDSGGCPITLPLRHLYRDFQDAPLSQGIVWPQGPPSSASLFLGGLYTSTLRDIRQTYLRAFKAVLLAGKLGLSPRPIADDGQSELGYMLANPTLFAGLGYYRTGATFATYQANLDFNILPIEDSYQAPPGSSAPPGPPSSPGAPAPSQPAPGQTQAMFDWWERLFDYARARDDVHRRGDRHLWLLFYELTITHNYSRSLLPARKPAASKVRS